MAKALQRFGVALLSQQQENSTRSVTMKRLLLMIVMGCLPALGQTQAGAVSGRIRDPGGNSVASVRVTLARVDGNKRATASTNSDGFYRIEKLPAGQYTVFAGAVVAPLFPGTAYASQAVIYAQQTPFSILPGNVLSGNHRCFTSSGDFRLPRCFE